MAADITIKGTKAPRGAKMTKGNSWRLVATKGKKRVFAGTLLQTINFGKVRLAVFSVPK